MLLTIHGAISPVPSLMFYCDHRQTKKLLLAEKKTITISDTVVFGRNELREGNYTGFHLDMGATWGVSFQPRSSSVSDQMGHLILFRMLSWAVLSGNSRADTKNQQGTIVLCGRFKHLLGQHQDRAVR